MRPATVIPTLDEQASLPRLLDALAGLEAHRSDSSEESGELLVVIADGGSRDRTLEIARERGVHVTEAAAGRGTQIRAGAQYAWGLGADVVVVNHADTLPPPDLLEHLRAAIDRGALGGGCLVAFDPAPGLVRWAAPLVNWRTRRFGLALGDQLQWVTRDGWQRLGGYRPWPILEDFDFVRRLRRTGRLAILPCEATTASRRFLAHGAVRTVTTNWLIWALFFAGVPPATLARLYRKIR